MAFSAYGRPLEMVISFQYMGWVISEADNDWPTVFSNLSQARAVWKRMTIIIIREGAEPRVSVFFFQSVVQAVFLFGSEAWVVAPHMGRALVGFQDQVAQRLTGRIPRRKTEKKWEYTYVVTAREEAEFHVMEGYIRKKNGTQSHSTSLCDHC